METSQSVTIACLGSSTTASRGVFKWIDELQKRPQNHNYRFLNFGVGGDLAYSALQRVPAVIESNSDKVIILIGSNDILAIVFPKVLKFFTGWKKLPAKPSAQWFRENLVAIIRELKQKTSADIIVGSLAEVGEDPNSKDPHQARLNDLFREFADIIKQVSLEEKVTYMPFYEEFHKAVCKQPGKAFTEFSFASLYKDYLWREFILRKSFDQIAEMNGWRLHVDGIHLNTRGGTILVECVQRVLVSTCVR